MDVVRHDHKPNATGRVLRRFRVEHAQQDPFQVVVVQQPTSPKDGERDEVGVQPVIDDPPTVVHGIILPDRRA